MENFRVKSNLQPLFSLFNSRYIPKIFLIFAFVLLSTCTISSLEEKKEKKIRPPMIRVGILEDREIVDFYVSENLTFNSQDGSIALRGLEGGRWRVESVNAKPAQFKYHLAVAITKDRRAAEQKVREVSDRGFIARIQKFELHSDSYLPYVNKSVYQVVLDKEFTSEDEAKLYQKKIREKIETEIVEEVIEKAQGTLRFTNLDNKHSFDTEKPMYLSSPEMKISDVEVGSGFHWETREDRIYGGTLEFLLDNHGGITVVNELSLEEYLKGVVPSEMPISFPLEALKAQAIAARVEALSKKGLRHLSEPFDVCDEVHCQVFSGKSKLAQSTNLAVENTRGMIMVFRNKLAQAFYAGVCGGHTENNENVWLMEPVPYLRGVLDSGRSTKKRLSTFLQEEKNLKKWIDSSPDVFCNTVRKKIPKSLNYSKKYFRWKIEYYRKDLEKIIRDKTGEDFGLLMDLVPLKRGVSGRLIQLEIVGTKKRFVISRELAIRQALSKNTLYSGCFYIKKKGGSKDLPQKFILKGAGWGHGVGMCQIGAAVMAYQGKKFDKILFHYYTGIELKRIY